MSPCTASIVRYIGVGHNYDDVSPCDLHHQPPKSLETQLHQSNDEDICHHDTPTSIQAGFYD